MSQAVNQKRGRPPKFTRQQVQEAALAIVDTQGLVSLSMRALADALGTGPMTIYNHVANREDLEELLVDAVFSRAAWPAEAAMDWKHEVSALALVAWRCAREHPNLIPLILTRRSRSPAMLDFSEKLLRALSRGGLRDKSLLIAFRAVTAFIVGFSQADLAGPFSASTGDTMSSVIKRFRALPPERYGCLVAAAELAGRSLPEEEFSEGLSALLRGLT